MRTLGYATILSLATFAPVLAGATIDPSVVVVRADEGGCSGTCAVGDYDLGNPGISKGGHFRQPGDPDGTATASGSGSTGHRTESTSVKEETRSGTFKTGTFRGHTTCTLGC